MADKTATFNLKIEADAKAPAAAKTELEAFKKAIDSSKAVIEQYSKSLRSLRGNSDEVKSAKAQLKARIDAERDAISRNSLSILKLGTSYEQLSKKTKTAESSTKSFSSVVGTVGGPVSDVTGKLGGWQEALEACADPMTALGLIAAAAVASFVVFAAAVVTATLSLARFVAESGNALRAQNLMREGVLGSEANAKAFGHQIDDLANKLSTPKDKLNDLAVELSRTFNNSRVSGQAIVDTFQAVARASDAMGEQAGSALKGIVERGKLSGRVGINPIELRQIGLNFNDVAERMAKSMKTGVGNVRQALLSGTAPVGAAAQALREAAEARFGKINAAKLLDLNVISAKFKENLAGLTKDVDLTPFLESLKTLADLFSDTTSTGHSLKVFVTSFGDTLGVVAKAALPYLVQGIKLGINYMLRFANVMLDGAIAVVKFGQSTTGRWLLHAALETVIFLANFALGTLQKFIASASRTAAATDSMFSKMGSTFSAAKKIFSLGWDAVGSNLVAGLWNGIKAGWVTMLEQFKGLVALLPASVRKALGITSPSRVFHEIGRQTTAGFAEGVQSNAGDASEAVMAVTAAPAAAAPSGGATYGGGGRPPMVFNFNISGADAQKTVTLLKSDSVLDLITHAVEIASRGIGVPTQQAAGA